MKILAIETSCDETAAAVLEVHPVKSSTKGRGVSDKKQFDRVSRGHFNLLSNIVSSQEKIHAKYGGIVPEVAARKQIEMIMPIIDRALTQAKCKLDKIDYLAMTYGPGLITSLTVGVETAKALSLTLNKPLIPVNHLAGHVYANWLNHKNIKFPAVCLIVSGGHTMLVLIKKHGNHKIIGQTLDDAAGEAFDKVAKILNLGYPGGPVISKLAVDGDAHKFDLPRPMLKQNNFDFSFSGLKTAVLYLTQKPIYKKTKNNKVHLCASFQQAVIDVLVGKTLRAVQYYKPKSFLLGGGVAANPQLRKQLQEKISAKFPHTQIYIPEIKFTGDNAAMIAAAAYFEITRSTKTLKHLNTLNLKADPNLSF